MATSATFICQNCKKETRTKDGIEGTGPYFVRCEFCDAKHKLKQSSFDIGKSMDFEIDGLLTERP